MADDQVHSRPKSILQPTEILLAIVVGAKLQSVVALSQVDYIVGFFIERYFDVEWLTRVNACRVARRELVLELVPSRSGALSRPIACRVVLKTVWT